MNFCNHYNVDIDYRWVNLNCLYNSISNLPASNEYLLLPLFYMVATLRVLT